MSDRNPHTGAPRKPAQRAMNWIAQERWAIKAESLQLIMDIAGRTHEPDFEAVLAKRGTAINEESQSFIRGSTAVIPVSGPIFRYANLFTMFSGASSIEMMALDLQQAQDSPLVKSIILDIDSPGGMVSGTSEFAAMVRASRKPVVAYVGNMAASAAYWIASAAGSIVMNDTAQLGSIGVVSGMYKKDPNDEVVEIVSSQSPNKRVDIETDEGRALVQKNTDELADVFIDAVAGYRGVTRDKVLSDFGAGGLLIGKNAIGAGMGDRLGSLELLIAQLNR